MSAGMGVMHSEFNPSKTDPVHLLQIWILPERRGIEPGYEQKTFTEEERSGKLRLVASRAGREGSVTIHQDAEIYAGILDAGERASYALAPGRHAWLQVARGSLDLNGLRLTEGDGAAIGEKETIELAGQDKAEILLFDLA